MPRRPTSVGCNRNTSFNFTEGLPVPPTIILSPMGVKERYELAVTSPHEIQITWSAGQQPPWTKRGEYTCAIAVFPLGGSLVGRYIFIVRGSIYISAPFACNRRHFGIVRYWNIN